MEYIKVDTNCNGCGLCFRMSKYICESDDGKAMGILGHSIPQEERLRVQREAAICPIHALSIEKKVLTQHNGREGVEDIIRYLEQWEKGFSVTYLEPHRLEIPSDIDFMVEKLTLLCVLKLFRFHNTQRAAMSYAKSCFYDTCYSEKAWRPIVRKALVDFTVHQLSPYYCCEDSEQSVYYGYNQDIRQVLGEAYAELVRVMPSRAISVEWKGFSCYPKSWMIEALTDYNRWKGDCSVMESVREELNTEGTYTYQFKVEGTSGYVDGLLNFFSREGCYSVNYGSALEDFTEDLKNAITFLFTEILEPEVMVNRSLKYFEDLVKEAIRLKIENLRQFYMTSIN